MLYNIIASGSKGNATIVKYNDTVVLIDMGITLERLTEGLNEIGLNVNDIDGAIFTHDHSDHYKGLKFLSPKKCYALKGTLPGSLSNIVNNNEPFFIKDIEIIPFPTSHDAKNPCGYKLIAGDESMVYMTDTGMFLEDNVSLLKNPTYLVIESNHDIKMLLHTNRPFELKTRIMSDHGHLCNEDSALAAIQIIGEDTKDIILAHLSEEANTPELALDAYNRIFRHFNININRYNVRCAHQWHSTLGGHHED